MWNAFDVIRRCDTGRNGTTTFRRRETNIFTDIANGDLPAMSWVGSRRQNSDHPGHRTVNCGFRSVVGRSIVNAIGASSYWNSSAVIVVWDDWGGFYDPKSPASRITRAAGLPRSDDRHLAVRQAARRLDPTNSAASCASSKTTSEPRPAGNDRLDLHEHGRHIQPQSAGAKVQNDRIRSTRDFFLHQKPSGFAPDSE